MYPVSDEYKLAVKQITRTFQLLINVFPADNVTMEEIEKILATVVQGVPDSEVKYSVKTVEDVKNVLSTVVEGFLSPEDAEKYVLYDNDIVTKTFKMSDNFVTGEDIEFGNAIAKDLAFTLTNYEGQWNDVDFTRATVIPMIGLLTESGYEYIPMGTFWVDEASKPMSTISLKALDGMARFSTPFAKVNVGYPCDLKTLFFAICDHCGIRTRVTSFLNDSVTVQQAPENIEKYTCRDMLAYIAMLAGCNARMSRDNYLEFVSFGSTGECHLEPVNRTKFIPEDYTIRITGLAYEDSEEEKTYFIGSDTYMLEIPENPLMPSDPSGVLNNLLNSFEEFAHQPFTAEYFGDPAIDCGDRITNIHSNGKTYSSYVTNNTFTFKGPCSLAGKGRLPEVYNSPTKESKRDAVIVAQIRKNRKEAEQRFSTLEQSVIQATNFMTQELGGYVYKTNNALYVMDTQDLETAKKLWKWGLGGFGYSANGKNGPFTTAITMDGQIVADFITAGTMSGERIQAGTITADTLTQSLLLAGDRISIQSTNFTLDWDGSITCNDATLYGDFTTDIATIDNEGVNVYYGCLNVFKGSKNNPGAYALHIEPYYTLINGGFQSSNFGMSMAIGAIYDSTIDSYYSNFLMWSNKDQTMENPLMEIYNSSDSNLVIKVGSGANQGIFSGKWNFSSNQTWTHNVYAWTIGVSRDNVNYGSLWVTTNKELYVGADNYQGLMLGVKGTDGSYYRGISIYRQSSSSNNIKGAFSGSWTWGSDQDWSGTNFYMNVLYLGTSNYSMYKSTSNQLCISSANSIYIMSGSTGRVNVETGGGELIGNWEIVDANNKYRLVTSTSGGTLYGAWDFSQEQTWTVVIESAYGFAVSSTGGTRYGSFYKSSSNNPCFNSDQGNNFIFSVNSTSRIVATSSGGNLYGTWYQKDGNAITSDANRKHSIEDLPAQYLTFLEKLRPVRFKYNDNTSDRFHTGLIAQDVAQALSDAGISTKDFAGYVEAKAACPDPDAPSDQFDEYLALRYEEFIGPLIGAVQKLSQRVKTLEAIIQGGEGNGTEGQ